MGNLVDLLNAELERLGARDGYGESGGIIAWEEDGKTIIGDEGYEQEANWDTLENLRQLPDDAGWEAVWEAI